MASGDIIGLVTQVHGFPVKSMGSDVLQTGDLNWNGLAGDRQYAFGRSSNRGSFPYLTAREVPNLLLYRARYVSPEQPGNSAIRVTAPNGVVHDLQDSALRDELAEAAGEPVHLMQLGRGHFDTAPVSLVATTTAKRLAQAYGGPVALERFRINLTIEPTDPEAWDPDWLGRSLIVGEGSARLRVDMPIERCAMITLDPVTAQRDVAIMKMVARQFGNEVGMYCATEMPGQVRPGDAIRLR